MTILRTIIEQAREEIECGLGDLTVLSAQVDPYRLDTDAGRRDGEWAARELTRAIGPERKIHWRGFHYALVVQGTVRKPNGQLYLNTDDDWVWLSEKAGKAARWLGFVPFARITDNRNAEPVIYRRPRVEPKAFVSVGLDVAIPDVDDIGPVPVPVGFEARQRFQFVIYGEKASLADVVEPIARRREADLFLITGEISETRAHQIAEDALADGRPLVVFVLVDCDPAGRQMAVSIARKLQALRDLEFPTLRFEVVTVALTVEQVQRLGLPSTPLKDTEKRADRWREAFGIEQTEIDALATLQPNVLAQIIEDAFEPYWDATLEARVEAAKAKWHKRAVKALVKQIDRDTLEDLRAEAADKLAELRDAIEDINNRLRLAAGDHITLPPVEVPEAEVDEDTPRQALIAFDDDWVSATRKLIRHKGYQEENEHE
jgi:hypothetical protein